MDHSIRLSAIFWPAVLIGIGILIITRKNEKKYQFPGNFHAAETNDTIPKDRQSNRTEDFIDELAVFGGGNVRVASDNFRGGRITAIFGGSDIDLKNAKPAETCNIDLFILFGGSKLIVPEDWQVKSEVVSIFGGSTDKRVFPTVRNNEKLLVIKGVVLFGGVEIKSY
jgi:predicted membrane protein